MKITLTKTELVQMVQKVLCRDDVEDVIIVKGGKRLLNTTLDRIHAITGVKLSLTEGPPPNQKIPVIKALREIIPGLGLAEAKAISENWPSWISHVHFWGKYPTILSAYPFSIQTT